MNGPLYTRLSTPVIPSYGMVVYKHAYATTMTECLQLITGK